MKEPRTTTRSHSELIPAAKRPEDGVPTRLCEKREYIRIKGSPNWHALRFERIDHISYGCQAVGPAIAVRMARRLPSPACTNCYKFENRKRTKW